jgi:hypothetical protein
MPTKSTTGRVGGEKALAVYMSMEQLPRCVLLLTLLPVCIENAKRLLLEFLSLYPLFTSVSLLPPFPSQSDFYIPPLLLSLSYIPSLSFIVLLSQ